MRRRCRILLGMSLLLLVWGPKAAASRGLEVWLHGSVTNLGGEPLTGVELVIEPVGGEVPVLRASTDRHGKYRILLRRGELRYLMTLRLPDHQTTLKIVQPVLLADRDEAKGPRPASGERGFLVDFTMLHEEEVVTRAREDEGRGEVPAEEFLYAARILQNRAVTAAALGAQDLAEELFRESIDLDPTLVGARAGLVKVLHERGEFEELTVAAEAAWVAGDRDPEVVLLHCEALDRLARAGDLAEPLARLSALDPPAAAGLLYRRAAAATEAGSDAEAARLLADALAVSPQHVEALYLAGVVALRTGRGDEAEGYFQALVSAAPEHARAEDSRMMLRELVTARRLPD